MENSLKLVDEGDLGYSRQRFKNRVFTQLVDFFATESEDRNFTKRDLAAALGKDAAQLNRILNHPSNLTLETISDLLSALDAEMDTSIVKFSERSPANYMHPLLARIKGIVGGGAATPWLPIASANTAPGTVAAIEQMPSPAKTTGTVVNSTVSTIHASTSVQWSTVFDSARHPR